MKKPWLWLTLTLLLIGSVSAVYAQQPIVTFSLGLVLKQR
jgi:hypothetical protein